MPLIGRNTEKNAVGLTGINPKNLSFQDLKPGITVEVTDTDRRLVRKYIVVRFGDCTEEIQTGVSDNSLILLTERDATPGYSYWNLKYFNKEFPNHYRWDDELFISNVWMTTIDTKNMTVEKLKKIFNETVNKLA